jgi:hypothetical protein
MMQDSAHFAYWLRQQPSPGILPNQIKAVINIMDRLPTCDLISVLYLGDDEQALHALKLLKARFEDEMNALDEMNKHQGVDE